MPRSLRRNELFRMRRCCEAKMPIPSPSGSGLSSPELSRTRLRADSAITKPKNWLLEEETFSTRLWRALPTNTPDAKPRTEPFRTVIPSWPSLTTPTSQISFLGS